MKRSSFTRNIYKALSISGSVHSARRGVLPLGRRMIRQRGAKLSGMTLRKLFRP